MHFSTITITAIIAVLAGQQVVASPTPSMPVEAREAEVKAMYETLGKHHIGKCNRFRNPPTVTMLCI
jgi:cytochrome c556